GGKKNISNLGYNTHSNDTWVYLCTDSVVARDTSNTATEGVLRDHFGNWIMGFNHYLGNCFSFVAKVWGILDGILLLLDKGYRRAIILSNNLEVIQVLSDFGLENPGITVLKRTQRFMRDEGQWKIRHMSREFNLVADRLAKLSLTWKSSL
ncbi:hypothetical protein Gogos_000461, partial [Gossypium gossypioides]|nr:hypothetical protein [Gossypium gossypioides]